MKSHLMIAAALLTLLAVGFNFAQADDHKQDKADKPAKLNTAPEGWTALFDGESLVGWTVLSGKAQFVVADGSIKGTTRKGSPNTFLCTTKTYGDFELQFEVKLHDPQLNSGVQIRSKIVNPQGGKYGGRIGGPQVEIERSPGENGYIFGEASGGWLSPDKKNNNILKNDRWNHYHIIAKGNNIKTFVNGEPVEDLDLKDDYHQRFKEGVIGLQVHSVGGDPNWSVAWRNIYIKQLGE